MDEPPFRLPLYLPAQGATELEATIIQWHVSEGDTFVRGAVLAEIDSAKSVYDFEAPCAGRVVRIYFQNGDAVPLSAPLMEIETSDPAMRDWIPPVQQASTPQARQRPRADAPSPADQPPVGIIAVGAYLPQRVVTNAELAQGHPGISEDYVYQVTGIRQRHWAAEEEKPSDMALAAARQALAKAHLPPEQLDAVILATTTPDVAMPATACILQERLGLRQVPAFDLNAACSGWLYAVAMALGMIRAATARFVLTVGVDLQSRLLDPADPSACFIFGDGAGAAVIGATDGGHRLRRVILGADTRGLSMARRHQPGYYVTNGRCEPDPWIRLEGHSLFRVAAESFAEVIQQALQQVGWSAESVRWVVPHQANARILKAAARRSAVPFERFYLNMERVGNTSSASIPLALVDLEGQLQPGDRLLLCSVGAGMTTAAAAVEW